MHFSINDKIEELDSKLDIVLEKNEKDFLTAYRFHMLKVQNELVQLKRRANESELKTLQDSKLADLEKELHKYQDECMEIRKTCDVQEVEIKKINFTKTILIEHQEFLDYELMDCKSQNAKLKLQLSKNIERLESQNMENGDARMSLQNLLMSSHIEDGSINTMHQSITNQT